MFSLKQATKSNINNYKHAAVLVKSGRVISIGINKSKHGILGDPCYSCKGWHAELDALIKVRKDIVENSTLYVSGLNKSGVILSKPCRSCQEFLKKHKLKEIIYTTKENTYERIVI